MGNVGCGYGDPLLPGDADRGHGPLLRIPIPLQERPMAAINAVAWKTAQPFPPGTSAWGAPSPQPSPKGRGGCPSGYQCRSAVAWKTAQPFPLGLRHEAYPHPSPLPEGEGVFRPRISAVAWKTAQPFPLGTSAWGVSSPQPSPRERGGCPNGYQRRSAVAWKTAQPFPQGLWHGAPSPQPFPRGRGGSVRVKIRSLLALKIAGDRHKPVRIG